MREWPIPFQTQLSIMDTTGALRDLVMAPTPLQDKTHLVQLLNHTFQLCCYLHLVRVCLTTTFPLSPAQPLSLSHSHAPTKLLLEDTILGSHDSTMLEDPVWKGD